MAVIVASELWKPNPPHSHLIIGFVNTMLDVGVPSAGEDSTGECE